MVRTAKQTVGQIAKMIWPHSAGDGTDVHPGDIFMKLLEMASSAREARRPELEVITLERAARFVDAAEGVILRDSDTASARSAANLAYELAKGVLNPIMTWPEALEEIRAGHAVRRALWGTYVDAEFGEDASFPCRDADGTPFRAVLIQAEGTTRPYEPNEEDAAAHDWIRA